MSVGDAAPQGLKVLARQGRDWLFEAAAPLWRASEGSAPLFPERLSIHGNRDDGPHRLFVQARQVFSYCELGRLGWSGPWRPMVGANIDFLVANGRRADGFYIHRFDSHGRVLDARADLYDQAFMLLALAHAGRALERADLFATAEALADVLEARWRHAHGGFHEGEIAMSPPYRQNPHMHLLESFIALSDATGGGLRWRRGAEQLARLCGEFFFHRRTGALVEHFDAGLDLIHGDEGGVVEPGHCFEWVWLFERLWRWGLPEAVEISDGLASFARRHGLDPERGVAINEVGVDGSIRNASARLWPQTERLKAAVARCRRTRDSREAAEAAAAYGALARFLETPARGAWRDKLTAEGNWIEEPAPGSSLYHITCALAELIDWAGAEQGAEPAPGPAAARARGLPRTGEVKS